MQVICDTYYPMGAKLDTSINALNSGSQPSFINPFGDSPSGKDKPNLSPVVSYSSGDNLPVSLAASWQKFDPEKDSSVTIIKKHPNSKIAGDLYKVKLDDNSYMWVAPKLGGAVYGLVLNGLTVLDSPLILQKTKLKKRDISVSGLKGMPFISPPNRGDVIYDENGKPLINTRKRSFKDWLMGRNNFDKVEKHSIHGRLFKLAWRLESMERNTASGAIKTTVVFHTKDDSYLSKHFGDAEFRITYTLSKDPKTGKPSLEAHVKVKNLGEKKYPLVGFGFHPYFVTPKGAEIKMGAQKIYEAKNGIPTGKLSQVRPSVLEGDLDAVFTDLKKPESNDAAITSLLLKGSKGKAAPEIHIEQSGAFNHLVIFKGSNNKGYSCIEPQTCATDATRLAFKENLNVANPVFLDKGETLEAKLRLS